MTDRLPGAQPFIQGAEAAIQGKSAMDNPYPVMAGCGADWNAWNRGHGLVCRLIEEGRTAGNETRAGPGDDNAKSSVQTGEDLQQDVETAEGGPEPAL